MGEEGYSLTTFQTALAYLETLPAEQQETKTKEQKRPENESSELEAGNENRQDEPTDEKE